MEMILWLGAMILFLAIEAGTVGLVSIWFAAGSLAAFVASMAGASFPFQIGTCLIVSGLCLVALRPLVRKYIAPKIVKTNVDAVVGKTAVVTEPIDNLHATGAVKLGAVTWTARSTENVTIPKGSTVRIDRVEGVKLFVTAEQVKTYME